MLAKRGRASRGVGYEIRRDIARAKVGKIRAKKSLQRLQSLAARDFQSAVQQDAVLVADVTQELARITEHAGAIVFKEIIGKSDAELIGAMRIDERRNRELRNHERLGGRANSDQLADRHHSGNGEPARGRATERIKSCRLTARGRIGPETKDAIIDVGGVAVDSP